MQQENDEFDDLPEALVDRLKAADQSVPLLSARVDKAVLQLAQEQFSRRRSGLWRFRSAWAAVAATALLAFFILDIQAPRIAEPQGVYADIDGSGRVDIADVLSLARTAGESGEVTQAEIDAFAMQVVSLNPVGDAS